MLRTWSSGKDEIVVNPLSWKGMGVEKCMERNDLMILSIQEVTDESTIEQSLHDQVGTWLASGTTAARDSYLSRANQHNLDVQANATHGCDVGQIDAMPDWILDTGASKHLANSNHVNDIEFRQRVTERDTILLTANGFANFNKVVDTIIPSIQETMTVLVKPGNPNALSLGQLVMDRGYRFKWDPYEYPQFYGPDGSLIPVETRAYVPYLDNMGGCMMSAAQAQDSSGDPVTAAQSYASGSSDPVPVARDPNMPIVRMKDDDSVTTADDDVRIELEYVSDTGDDELDMKPTPKLTLEQQAKLESHLLTHKPTILHAIFVLLQKQDADNIVGGYNLYAAV